MATDSVMGLFADPQQIQQAQRQQFTQTAADLSQMDPSRLATFYAMQGGYGLGNAIGSALGAQDPQLQMATARKQIMQGVDQTNPQSLAQAAQALNQAGDIQGARALAQAAQEAAVKQSQITKNLREGNAAMLTTEQRNFKQAQDDGYKGSFNDWLTQQKRAGATNVSLSATADKSYGSQIGEGMAKSDLALRDAAMAAPNILTSIEQQRALLDSGKVYTGVGANAKLNVLAFGQALGATGATDNEIIANTQQLQQQRSKAVLSQIKSSGLGTGQGFTDKDLAFLERASAGNITLSTETIKRQLEAEENAAKALAGQWNKRVSTLPPQLTSSMGLTPVQLPTTPYKPSSAIPTTGAQTGVPLVDKYLVKPAGQ